MSKFIYFSFRCDRAACNHRYDKLVKPDVKTTSCPECGNIGRRVVSAVTIDPRMGLDPDNSTMYDKWARVREQKAKLDAKKAAEHGDD